MKSSWKWVCVWCSAVANPAFKDDELTICKSTTITDTVFGAIFERKHYQKLSTASDETAVDPIYLDCVKRCPINYVCREIVVFRERMPYFHQAYSIWDEQQQHMPICQHQWMPCSLTVPRLRTQIDHRDPILLKTVWVPNVEDSYNLWGHECTKMNLNYFWF